MPLVIVANAAVGKRWAHLAIGLLGGISAGLTFLLGIFDLAGAGTTAAGAAAQNPVPVDVGIMVTAVVAAAVVSRPVRELVGRVLPVEPDNPLHALALVLAVLLFGTQASSLFLGNPLAAAQTPLTVGDLWLQELPFVILAAAGVGLFMRRGFAQAMPRLGLVAPKWWQLTLALAAAGVFFAFAQGAEWLSHTLTPGVAQQVDATTQKLYGGMGGPLGIAALALAPGICEEILFRGALQPRLGIIATALLFTSIHAQYGLSLDAASVLVIAMGLGLIRRFTNTTTSMTCHATYNLLVGVGIAGSQQIDISVLAEGLLVVGTAYGVWSASRRRKVEVARP